MLRYRNLLLYLLVAASACTTGTPSNDSRVAFRYNQHNPITSLDPAFARTQNNIWAIDCLFNGLLQLDDDLLVRPCIAKKWEISDDALQYRFILRDDVFFHDDPAFPGGKGRKVVASDVVFSFNRLLDDEWPKPGSWIFKDRVAADTPFSAPDDSTFILRLAEPFQPMLSILTMQYASIVPREACERYGRDFRRHPVGTGPFRFKIWAENQGLVVLRNDRYFEKDSAGNRLPYLDAVKTTFITDRKTAFLEFKKGNLDYFFGLESSYINELLTPDGELQPALAQDIYFLKNPYLNTEYLGIRMDEQATAANPLQQKKVRQALNCGFDRSQMLRTLRNGVGKPASSGFTPRGLPSFDETTAPGYAYTPSRAARLLADAGFPNGKGLPPVTLLCNQDYLDLCTFIARQWEDLGIKVNLEMVETALLRERMRNGQAPFFRASWIADYPDAESFFTCFYSKNTAPPNYTGFHHPAFDRLYEASLREPDVQRRYALYRQMDAILIEEAPVVFLFYDETAQFAGKKISGLPRNGINLLSLNRVRKTK